MNDRTTYDAIVIGAGGMGSAAAYHLASTGASVLLVEQFATGHALGSSHGETRAIRMLYDKIHYTRLMPAAYREWRRLEAESGQSLMHITGSPVIAPEGHPFTVEREAMLREAGIEAEWWNPEELGRRFPQFTVDKDTLALWQKDTGFLLASRCVRANLEMAASRGVIVRDHTPVDEIQWQTDPLEVVAGGERFRGRTIVCTAGAWTGRLLADLELPLQVRRQQIAHFRTDDPGRYGIGSFPVFVDVTGPETMYGFPIAGIDGVKVARDGLGEVVDADQCNRVPDDEHLDYLRDFMRRRIPGAAGEVVEAQVCLYTETPDRDFIIDAHPDCDRLIIAAGFSGHGFKFAALVGRVVGEMALAGAPDTVSSSELEPFRLSRFSAAQDRVQP